MRTLAAFPLLLILASCSDPEVEPERCPRPPRTTPASVRTRDNRTALIHVIDEFVTREAERASWRRSIEDGALDGFTPTSLRGALETTRPLSDPAPPLGTAPAPPPRRELRRDLSELRKELAARREAGDEAVTTGGA